MNRCLTVPLTAGLLTLVLPAAPGDEPATLKPTNLDKVNTARDEDDPHLSANGLLLFYTSANKGKAETLISSRARKDAAWPAGKPMVELKEQGDVRGVFLTADGKYPQHLFFSCNYDPDAKDFRGNNYDIYYFIRQGPTAEFTTKTAVIGVDTPVDEMYPWLTPDNRQLYFSRKDKDGWHVYVSTRPAGGGGYQKPVLVNLPAGFHHATLDPRGLTMYLQGPLDQGRWGLFRSRRVGGKWGKPEPLTTLNNAEGPCGDLSPCLSRDGERLYFASDRPGGKGGLDLYVIPTAQLYKK
jgi:hypothetical protein